MLSYIFVFMIVVSVLISVFLDVGTEVSQSMIDGCADAVSLIVTMSGVLCLFSGVMEVAKESGLNKKLSRVLSPLLLSLFPNIDRDSKAFDYICMNVSANLLGLSNAATPLGLSAMKELKGNSNSVVASDDMINFVVLNTASIQLLPTTVAAMRGALGSKSPFDIIFCVWISSVVALLAGLFVSKTLCRCGRKRWSL